LELHVQSAPVLSSPVGLGASNVITTRRPLARVQLSKDAYESVAIGGQPIVQTSGDYRANLSTGQKIALGAIVVVAVVAAAPAASSDDENECTGLCGPLFE
jgi:hypothetical protein